MFLFNWMETQEAEVSISFNQLLEIQKSKIG